MFKIEKKIIYSLILNVKLYNINKIKYNNMINPFKIKIQP